MTTTIPVSRRRPFRRVAAKLAAVTLATAVVAGCGGGGGGSDEPVEGGTITVATGQDAIPQLDPGLATFHWEWVLYPLLWDGLTALDEESEVQPAIAESWESNDDFTEWTFQLRDDVTYWDGTPLEADDVVWNIERIIADDNASIANSYLEGTSGASSDGSTVVVTLDRANATLPLAISHLRIIAPDSVDRINEEPMGTGPFMVDSFVPSDSLKLVRNDDYWGEAPTLDGIDFEAVNDTAAGVTALRSGDIDVLWNVPARDAQALEGAADIRIDEPEIPTTNHYLFFDTKTPPFDDPRARQAVAYALDRESVRDTAFSGFGEPSLRNTLIPPDSWAHDDSLTEYEPDLARAKELFEDAGVTEGDTLTWWGIAGAYPEWQTEAQLLQESLEEIGITLKIENNEIGTWVDAFLPLGKEFPGYIVPNQGGDVNDPDYLLDRLTGGTYEGNWRSDELDALAARGTATEDEGERAAIYAEAQQLIDAEAPLVNSVHTAMLTAVRQEVEGLWTSSAGNLQLAHAYRTAP